MAPVTISRMTKTETRMSPSEGDMSAAACKLLLPTRSIANKNAAGMIKGGLSRASSATAIPRNPKLDEKLMSRSSKIPATAIDPASPANPPNRQLVVHPQTRQVLLEFLPGQAEIQKSRSEHVARDSRESVEMKNSGAAGNPAPGGLLARAG